MLTGIKHFFDPPIFPENPEKTHAAKTLNALLWGYTITLVLMGVVTLFIFSEKFYLLIILLIFSLILLAARVFLYYGHVQLASSVVVTFLWVVFSVIVFLSGGMTGLNATLYLAITVIAGLLLGVRAAIILAVVNSLAGLSMVVIEAIESPLPRIFPMPALSGWAVMTIVLVLVTITLNITLRNLTDALASAQKQVQERLKTEAGLRESEERFRILINSLDDIVFTLDLQQRYVGLYGNWMEKSGLTPEFFLGKTAREIFGPEAATVHKKANQRALAGENLVYEWSTPGPQGMIHYQTALSPLRNAGGQITGLVGIGRDITERKRAENMAYEERALAEALRETVAAISSTLDLDMVLDLIITNVEKVVPYDAISILLIEETCARVVRSRSSDIKIDYFLSHWEILTTDLPTFQQAVQQHQAVIVPDTQQFPNWITFPETEVIRSHICVPIVIHERVIGLLNLDSFTPNFYNPGHASRLQVFANQAAVALNNATLYAEVEHLAVADPLTGLYNRRGLFEFGKNEVRRVQRFKRPISVLFMDIDHFKQINDRYSYEVGDQVLQKIAQFTLASVRDVDLVSRYGGEEFVILLPENNLKHAVDVAERLRQGIEGTRMPTDLGTLSITVSIGVASLAPIPGRTSELAGKEQQILAGLIEEAGQMLHIAKAKGRNQIVSKIERSAASEKK